MALESPMEVCHKGGPQGNEISFGENVVEILVNEYVVDCEGLRCYTLLDYFVSRYPPRNCY